MKRVCLLLIISLMTLQETASKSTFSDWRAPTNNLTGNIGAWNAWNAWNQWNQWNARQATTRAETESKLTPGNQWPWTLGVSTPQNFYDSLYNHNAPITNSQELFKKIENLQKDLVDQTKKTEDQEEDLADQRKTIEDQRKKIEDLEKNVAEQTKETEDLGKDLDDQSKKTDDLEKSLSLTQHVFAAVNERVEAKLRKEVDNVEENIREITADIGEMDGRLSKAEMRTAVCGYQNYLGLSRSTTLTFDRVYGEVNSGGDLEESGYFTATIEGVYLVTLKTSVGLNKNEYLYAELKLSSGSYADRWTNEERFIYSHNQADGIYINDQVSASRYVKMAAGETLHIELKPYGGQVVVRYTTMCVSLYSTSG